MANIPAEQRRDLQVRIAGVLYAMVEIDYANLHAVMAYAQAGIDPRPATSTPSAVDRALVEARVQHLLLNATLPPEGRRRPCGDLAVRTTSCGTQRPAHSLQDGVPPLRRDGGRRRRGEAPADR